MNRPTFFLSLSLFLAAIPLCAHAGLDGFLGDLNRRAAASPTEYHTSLANQFGLPQPQVASLMKSVATPSDAFMVLQVGKMINKPHDQVLRTYNANRGKGWGVIAQELGIKPGSPEFHALKDGRFSLTGKSGQPSHDHGPGKHDPKKQAHDHEKRAHDYKKKQAHDHEKRDLKGPDHGKTKDKKKERSQNQQGQDQDN